MLRPGRSLCAAAAATLIVASACSDPQSPKPPSAFMGAGYSLAVTVTTTGSDIDPDGYAVWVDNSQKQPVGTTGVVMFSVPEGPHELALYGVASNCTVDGFSPRMVWDADGLGAATTFSVD